MRLRRLSLLLAALINVPILAAPTVALADAPSWAQNHRPTTLWSGPDAQAIAFGDVPSWSGFQVLGKNGNRLFVRYLGNGVNREPGIAWVDQADVGPTDRPLLWVSPFEETPLWSGPDENAVAFGIAPAGGLMVRLGPASNGRAQVYFLGTDQGHQPGLVWVEVASLAPSLAPPDNSPLWQVWGLWDAKVSAEARRLAAPPPPRPTVALTRPATTPITFADQQRFVEEVAAIARRLRQEVGLPPSLVIAMAINESGWGRSALAQQAHNYFGIKAHRGPGTAGVVEYETWEVIDGKNVTIEAPFRAYRSLEESVRDLGAFLRSNVRYQPVWSHANHPQEAARALLQAGYATDPAWADKLVNLMGRYNLQRFDA